MNEADEYTIHLRSRTDKTYVGPSFPTLSGQRLRIANKYIDGEGGYEFATVKDEIVLRTTPGGRFQIKATFVEDDRSFRTVTIQRRSRSRDAGQDSSADEQGAASQRGQSFHQLVLVAGRPDRFSKDLGKDR